MTKCRVYEVPKVCIPVEHDDKVSILADPHERDEDVAKDKTRLYDQENLLNHDPHGRIVGAALALGEQVA